MAKDYVKYSTYRKPGKFRSRMWVILYLLIALFLGTGLFFFKSHQKQETNKVGNKLKQQLLETPTPKPPGPEFDFYNILPRDNITISSSSQATNDSVSLSIVDQGSMNLSNNDSNEVSSIIKKPLNLLNSTPEQVAIAEAKKQLEHEMAQLVNEFYILVLGNFQVASKAEQYKSQALLKGFSVQSRLKVENGHKSYQLYMGPYPSLTLASQQQKRLNAAGMSGLLIRFEIQN